MLSDKIIDKRMKPVKSGFFIKLDIGYCSVEEKHIQE
jgi:hypothetical protein